LNNNAADEVMQFQIIVTLECINEAFICSALKMTKVKRKKYRDEGMMMPYRYLY